jgi:hypothetical protein
VAAALFIIPPLQVPLNKQGTTQLALGKALYFAKNNLDGTGKNIVFHKRRAFGTVKAY